METAHEVGPAVGKIGERLEAEADAQGDGRGDGRALIVPNRRTVGKGTLEVVSTGFLVDEVAPPVGNASVDMTGCSARLLESVESAFAELDARA